MISIFFSNGMDVRFRYFIPILIFPITTRRNLCNVILSAQFAWIVVPTFVWGDNGACSMSKGRVRIPSPGELFCPTVHSNCSPSNASFDSYSDVIVENIVWTSAGCRSREWITCMSVYITVYVQKMPIDNVTSVCVFQQSILAATLMTYRREHSKEHPLLTTGKWLSSVARTTVLKGGLRQRGLLVSQCTFTGLIRVTLDKLESKYVVFTSTGWQWQIGLSNCRGSLTLAMTVEGLNLRAMLLFWPQPVSLTL